VTGRARQTGAQDAPAAETANLDKAIEIKRRAQRCVQNGDLDGALAEYEKLVAAEDSDPYNYVLLADLLYKKGDQAAASSRYLAAAEAYERAGLYKNGIAVCKKMMRLSLSQSPVLQRLAVLHELDGIATEASLYYAQFAEALVREDRLEDAVVHFRKAFEVCPESVKPIERLAEVHALRGDRAAAAAALREAAGFYQRAGQLQDADRCRTRAAQVDPAGGGSADAPSAPSAAPASAPLALETPRGFEDLAPVAGSAETLALDAPDAAAVPGTLPEDAAAAPAPPRLDVDAHRAAAVTAADDAPRSVGPPRLDAPRLAPGASGAGTGTDDTEAAEAAPSENGAAHDGPPRLDARATVRAAGAADAPAGPFAANEAPAADDAPGLAFGAPAAAGDAPPPEAATADERAADGADDDEAPGADLGRVEQWLARAQEHFRSGDRDAAGAALAEAAREYDALGQHDSAATIYRSLGKSAHATREVLEAWLANCERRADGVEAAQVACDLGDRALNDGDTGAARGWFERALALDPGNALAPRRLQRLAPAPAGAPVAAPAAAAPAPGLPEPGRVEVAVGRGEAVTFDLGSLVAEFQRGVEMQISGDPQGHYDLAMAYREMGLLEQALEGFRLAAGDPAFAHRCAEMAGRCLLDQGRFDEAVEEFRNAIAMPGARPEQIVDLRFQLGLAYEAAGQVAEALREFEQVYAAQSNYPDVALKIRVLRKSLDSRAG